MAEQHQPRGVCWSGMDDHPSLPIPESMRERVMAEYAANLAKWEAQIAASAERRRAQAQGRAA